jgi:hypothetical protein
MYGAAQPASTTSGNRSQGERTAIGPGLQAKGCAAVQAVGVMEA